MNTIFWGNLKGYLLLNIYVNSLFLCNLRWLKIIKSRQYHNNIHTIEIKKTSFLPSIILFFINLARYKVQVNASGTWDTNAIGGNEFWVSFIGTQRQQLRKLKITYGSTRLQVMAPQESTTGPLLSGSLVLSCSPSGQLISYGYHASLRL